MVYYGVGRNLSQHTRKGVWGTGAIKSISEQLRRELPGLRGFSESSMKNMRQFYEEWIMLDIKSPIAIGNLENDNKLADSQTSDKSPIATDDFRTIDDDVKVGLMVAPVHSTEFPIEDFFRVPFTHHIELFRKSLTVPERYYYMHRVAEEHLSVDALKRCISNGDIPIS